MKFLKLNQNLFLYRILRKDIHAFLSVLGGELKTNLTIENKQNLVGSGTYISGRANSAQSV